MTTIPNPYPGTGETLGELKPHLAGPFAVAALARLHRILDVYGSGLFVIPYPGLEVLYIQVRAVFLEMVRAVPGVDTSAVEVALPEALTDIDALIAGDIFEESIRPELDAFRGHLLRACVSQGIDPLSAHGDAFFHLPSELIPEGYVSLDTAIDQYARVKDAGVRAWSQAFHRGWSLEGCMRAASKAAGAMADAIQRGTDQSASPQPRSRTGRPPKSATGYDDETVRAKVREIRSLRRRGVSDRVIGDRLGISKDTVRRWADDWYTDEAE
jgi:hypothetical protein